MGIGALIPILITSFYFWSLGIFKAMFDASITYNFTYSGTKLSGTPAIAAGLQNLGLAGWCGLVGYGVIFSQLINERWRAKMKPWTIQLLLLIGGPLAVAVSDPAQRNYGHYFVNWLPFIALLAGLTFYTIQNLMSKFKELKFSESSYLGFALLVAVILFVFGGLANEYWRSFSNLLGRSEVERDSVISVYVENNTKPGDFVLFWGGFPGENLMAHRASPIVYLTYPQLFDTNLSGQLSDQTLFDLIKNRPVLIVDMDYAKDLSLDPKERAVQLEAHEEWPYMPAKIDEVLSFIDNNYHLEIIFRNATVYRLNGTTGP